MEAPSFYSMFRLSRSGRVSSMRHIVGEIPFAPWTRNDMVSTIEKMKKRPQACVDKVR